MDFSSILNSDLYVAGTVLIVVLGFGASAAKAESSKFFMLAFGVFAGLLTEMFSSAIVGSLTGYGIWVFAGVVLWLAWSIYREDPVPAVLRANGYANATEAARAEAANSASVATAAKADAEAAKAVAVAAEADVVKAKVDAEARAAEAKSAKTVAEAAKADAESAKTVAETAKVGAESAQVKSEAAKTSAESAATKAEAAANKAESQLNQLTALFGGAVTEEKMLANLVRKFILGNSQAGFTTPRADTVVYGSLSSDEKGLLLVAITIAAGIDSRTSKSSTIKEILAVLEK